MKKFIGLVLFLISLPVVAQEEEVEMRWENVTALNFAATNGTDKENALQQYLLFDEAVLDRNRTLLEQYKTFAEEFVQMSLNAEAPQMNKAIDEMNEWLVAKDGKNWGFMDGNMKIVIPMKYDSLWDGHDNVIEMLRFDKMLDVYDATTFRFLRTIPKPHD